MFKSASTSLILLGVLAIVAGIGSDETAGSRAMYIIGTQVRSTGQFLEVAS